MHSHITPFRVAGLYVLLALGQTATAEAAGLQVSPAIIDRAMTSNEEALPPINVSNNDAKEMEVTVRFGGLTHNVFGQPLPTMLANGYPYAGEKLLSTPDMKFRLKPGAKRAVTLKVKAPKGRKGGAYAIAYFLAKPVGNEALKGSGVIVHVQVGVLVRLAFPGAATHAVKGTSVFTAQEAAGKPVMIYSVVKNDGNVHENLSGTVVIQDARGAEVGKALAEPSSVLPGLERAIIAKWQPPATVKPGKYKVVAALTTEGKVPVAVTGTLEILKPGEIARKTVAVTKLAPPPAVKMKPIPFEATVINKGNVPFDLAGKLVIGTQTGEVALVDLKVDKPIVVGAKGTMKGTLAQGLPTGKYFLRLGVLDPNGLEVGMASGALQVLDRDPNVTATIAKVVPPSEKAPYVSVELQNTGNAEIEAEGAVLIVDSQGNTVDQVVLARRAIAPGKSYTFAEKLPELTSGVYELQAVLNYGGKAPATKNAKYFAK